ncbi:MAG: TonB family protein [Sinobacteraceae bacterium]|nr:TonB family protein [Nevskiaceae bacterium]
MSMRVANGLQRFLAPLGGGLVVVVGLFWLLHTLIAYNGSAPKKLEVLPTIDFVRLKKSLEIETKEHKPPQMPDKVQAPPELPTQHFSLESTQGGVNIGPMKVEKDVAQNAGFALSASDGDYLPIVKVAPLYPESARERGIEGYVLLEFTVTETGSVIDPQVLESQPPGVFDDAAKKAVLRFKYKPRIENGRPVQVHGVKQVITFKLDKNTRG